MNVIVLLLSLTLLSSCQIPTYKIVERCDLIESMDICRCSAYNFNIPQKIDQPYSMPLSHCTEKRVTFSFDDFQTKIVPVRSAKRELEQQAEDQIP